MLDSLIDKMVSQPLRLFLIDGLGALLSAFLLGVVLVQLQEFIGVSTRSLYILAFFPVLFAFYDVVCYHKLTNNYGNFIKYIAIANILYCLFSIFMMFSHSDSLTVLGLAYFVIEILIVSIIGIIELKVAARIGC